MDNKASVLVSPIGVTIKWPNGKELLMAMHEAAWLAKAIYDAMERDEESVSDNIDPDDLIVLENDIPV